MKDRTAWFLFTALFVFLATTELLQFRFDPNNFDPFWLGWDLAFSLSCLSRALDSKKVT